MYPPSDPLDVGIALAQAFEAHGIEYALGGALAYGIWGIPRATLDVDVNVFVEDDGLHRLATALASLGLQVDVADLARDSHEKGLIVLRYSGYRVGLFTPSIPFSHEAARTRRGVDIDGKRIYFLSPEALCVFKLLFFRPKDIVDLERLLEVQGDALDHAYVRHELVTMMGDQDERVKRWDELTAART